MSSATSDTITTTLAVLVVLAAFFAMLMSRYADDRRVRKREARTSTGPHPTATLDAARSLTAASRLGRPRWSATPGDARTSAAAMLFFVPSPIRIRRRRGEAGRRGHLEDASPGST